jgi:hypothetical protein
MCFSWWYVSIIWCSQISSIDVVHCLKACWFLWNVWITSFYVEAISLRIDHHGSLMSKSQQIWWQFCARYLECLYCENYQMGHMITQYSSKSSCSDEHFLSKEMQSQLICETTLVVRSSHMWVQCESNDKCDGI